jgi:tetratricopeptide (TPR) repeat protein
VVAELQREYPVPPRLARILLTFAVLPAACAAARPTTPPPETADAAPPPPAQERRASGEAIAQYLRARLADGAGDKTGAIDALRMALVHDPDSPQLRIAYAEALARAGQVERAEAEAQRALEMGLSGAAASDAHLVLGKVMALSGRAEQSVRELQEAARLEAERYRAVANSEDEEALDSESWRTLARVKMGLGDEAGASAVCEKLAELDRDEGAAALRELGARLLESRRNDMAAKELSRAVELAPAEPEGWKLLAQAEEARERITEARKAWERALIADPEDLDALLAAGQLALHQGDLGSARAWLRQLLHTAPDESAARVRVATLWLEAKQASDALETTSSSEDPRLVYLNGIALQQLRRWDAAAAAFNRVKPASGELYSNARVSLGYALARAGKPAEAVRAIQRGLESSPKDPALLFALGEAYERAGQREAAMEQMRLVLDVKADHAEALNYLGYAYAERREHLEEAQALVERALVIEPENGYYLDSLGWVLYQRGDYDRAVKTLEHAVALVGPEATVLDHLGDAYRAMKRVPEAASAYRRAIEAFDKSGSGDDFGQRDRASIERKLREVGRGGPPPQPVTAGR